MFLSSFLNANNATSLFLECSALKKSDMNVTSRVITPYFSAPSCFTT